MGIYNDGNDASNVKFYHGIIVSHVISFVEWEILLRGMLDVYSQAQIIHLQNVEWRETDTCILTISSWSVKP